MAKAYTMWAVMWALYGLSITALFVAPLMVSVSTPEEWTWKIAMGLILFETATRWIQSLWVIPHMSLETIQEQLGGRRISDDESVFIRGMGLLVSVLAISASVTMFVSSGWPKYAGVIVWMLCGSMTATSKPRMEILR